MKRFAMTTVAILFAYCSTDLLAQEDYKGQKNAFNPTADSTSAPKPSPTELTEKRKKLVAEYDDLTARLKVINRQLAQSQDGYATGRGLTRSANGVVHNTAVNFLRDGNNKAAVVRINKKGIEVRSRLRAIDREVKKIDDQLNPKPSEPETPKKSPESDNPKSPFKLLNV